MRDRVSTILRIIDSDDNHPQAINHYWNLKGQDRERFAARFLNGRV